MNIDKTNHLQIMKNEEEEGSDSSSADVDMSSGSGTGGKPSKSDEEILQS